MSEVLWTPPSGSRPAAAPRPRAESHAADEPIVELMEGITLHRASIVRIRRLGAALLTALAALALQVGASQSGFAGQEPPAPVRPPAVSAARGDEVSRELEMLVRFREARARMTDLVRVGSVLPATALDVRGFSLSDPSEVAEACIRVNGVELDAGAAEDYAATVSAVMPAARVELDVARQETTPRRFGVAVRIRNTEKRSS